MIGIRQRRRTYTYDGAVELTGSWAGAGSASRVADPKIGNGTIDEAIKRQIKNRRRGEDELPATALILPRKIRDKLQKVHNNSKRNFRPK